MHHTTRPLLSWSRGVIVALLPLVAVPLSGAGPGADEGRTSLPRVDAERLAFGAATYRTTFTIDDEEKAVATRRVLSRVRDEGNAVVRLQEVSVSTPGGGETVTDLAAGTLEPQKRVTRQATASADIRYHPDRVAGLITMADREFPVSVDLAGPVFGEGAALETAIAALPLAEGYETSLDSVETGLLQRVRRWSLAVAAREEIEVAAGRFATFRVELEPLDEAGGGKTLWVSAGLPRLVIQVENRLEPALGGNVTTTRLITAP